MEHTFKFSVSHAADGGFDRGLRAFFEYRDLGIKEATAGLVVAHVTRSCVHQPPGIRHSERGHSGDVEMLEMVMPADFKTAHD